MYENTKELQTLRSGGDIIDKKDFHNKWKSIYITLQSKLLSTRTGSPNTSLAENLQKTFGQLDTLLEAYTNNNLQGTLSSNIEKITLVTTVEGKDFSTQLTNIYDPLNNFLQAAQQQEKCIANNLLLTTETKAVLLEKYEHLAQWQIKFALLNMLYLAYSHAKGKGPTSKGFFGGHWGMGSLFKKAIATLVQENLKKSFFFNLGNIETPTSLNTEIFSNFLKNLNKPLLRVQEEMASCDFIIRLANSEQWHVEIHDNGVSNKEKINLKDQKSVTNYLKKQIKENKKMTMYISTNNQSLAEPFKNQLFTFVLEVNSKNMAEIVQHCIKNKFETQPKILALVDINHKELFYSLLNGIPEIKISRNFSVGGEQVVKNPQLLPENFAPVNHTPRRISK